MKDRHDNPSFPLHDYSGAIESAVSWLGDRHLLAVPLTARPPRRRPPIFLMQSAPWLRTARHGR